MRITLTSVLVDDQAKALRFYTDVLGFEKKPRRPAGEHRWLTVVSPSAPDGPELLLEPAGHPAVEAVPGRAGRRRHPVHVSSPSTTSQAEYDRLRAAGVEFTQPPTDLGP